MAATPTRLAVWIVCIAAFCGAVVTYRALPHDFRPGPDHPGWPLRYATLAASLRNETTVMLVSDDDGGTAGYKAFRAQFVLSPLLIERRPALDRVRMRQLAERPLILDASSAASLDAMSERIKALAEGSGLGVDVERVHRTLALVRARGPQ